jgi:hypothetical protein
MFGSFWSFKSSQVPNIMRQAQQMNEDLFRPPAADFLPTSRSVPFKTDYLKWFSCSRKSHAESRSASFVANDVRRNTYRQVFGRRLGSVRYLGPTFCFGYAHAPLVFIGHTLTLL